MRSKDTSESEYGNHERRGGGSDCDGDSRHVYQVEMENMKSEDGSLNEEEESLLMEIENPNLSHNRSFLGGSGLPNVIITPSKGSPKYAIERETPARLASPDPDIQLAHQKPEHFSYRGDESRRSQSTSEERTPLCGPRPGKITAVCLVIVSIWISWILIIHLNKELNNMAVKLDETNLELRVMEQSSLQYRAQSEERIAALENKLQKLLRLRKGGTGGVGRNRPVDHSSSNHSRGMRNSSQPVEASTSSNNNDDMMVDTEESSSTVCAKSGRPCVFPLIYHGVTYVDTCVKTWRDMRDWCATETNADGNHVSWEACAPCSS